MRILAIDTSTQYTFLALCSYQNNWNTEKMIHAKTDRNKDNWLELLIQDFCEKTEGISLKNLDGFAAGYGPGSFTGLRISFTYLKTLAILWNKIFVTFSTSRFYHSIFCKTDEVLLVQANRNLYFSCDPYPSDKINNMHTLPEWVNHYTQYDIQKEGKKSQEGIEAENKSIQPNAISDMFPIRQKKILLWNQYPAVDNAQPTVYPEVDPLNINESEKINLDLPEPDYILNNKKELMTSMPYYGHDVIINRKL